MTPASLRRLLLSGGALALAGVVTVLLVAPALGFRWDPFNRADRRISELEARLQRAEAAASAAARLAAEEAAQGARLETHYRTKADADRVVADLAVMSTEASDARQPLSPDRAARLRDADRRLCGLAPELCRPTPQPPGRHHDAVPPAGSP
ncbi:MAG TPA: hypothetical protein VGR32_08480 [Brevundimonas sp.]|jgi:hypothetical protein|uniref:hypothetical protein n=1 Tax=Brevundimonas sp. TaxID=1871086 RepID=UPI002DE45746|nr:hypothetical protein [Brevundimonas sp.]